MQMAGGRLMSSKGISEWNKTTAYNLSMFGNVHS